MKKRKTIINNDNNSGDLRKWIKNRLQNDGDVVGWNELRDSIHEILDREVSDSLLLIGPKGTGKTKLVNHLIDGIVESKRKADIEPIVVRLNGLLHTDDKLAWRSIKSQMHFDESLGTLIENVNEKDPEGRSKTVYFVLEEFDLFCGHPKQSLLYALFEAVMYCEATMILIGLTCRIDVMQLLEKRLRSRISDRKIFVFPETDATGQLSDLDLTLNRVRCYLTIPEECFNGDSKQWNSSVDSLLANKKFKSTLQRLIDLSQDEGVLRNILFKCVCDLSDTRPVLSAQQFEEELIQWEKDDLCLVLQDLSVLELCLMIAMKHHNEIYDNQPMNFEMIYSRYVKFANKHSSLQNVKRAVVLKAFEHIVNLELVSFIQQGGSKLQKDYQFFRLLVSSGQIDEAIKKTSDLPTEVAQWAQSSLV